MQELDLYLSPMSYTSNALAVTSRSRTDAAAASGNATTAGTTTRLPPDILTYCHGSRMVYVTPGEDYDVRSNLPSYSAPQC